MNDKFTAPFVPPDSVTLALIDTIMAWRAMGCPSTFTGPRMPGDPPTRWRIREALDSDGEYFFVVEKEFLKHGSYGFPMRFGPPLKVLRDVLNDLSERGEE